MILTIIVFVLVLGLLVFVHELGHFLVAKKAGCKVEEFGFGFPPRIFGIKKGETLYSINWLPLGGFVKIHGEDGASKDDPRSFASKKAWVRSLILGAGIGMNLVLAMVLFAIGFTIGFPQAVPAEGIPGATIREQSIQITGVEEGSPAEEIGLQPLDEIISLNGEAISSIEDLTSLSSGLVGQEASLEYNRQDETFTKSIKLRDEVNEEQGALGVEIVSAGLVSYPWYKAIWLGITTTLKTLWLIIASIFLIIKDAFQTGQVSGDAVTGPVGIAVLTGQFLREGAVYLMWFAAFLSINLAFINAIPFPALDGGRLLFVGIEKLRGGKKVKPETENYFHLTGFVLLLILVVVVTFRDVIRFQDSFVRLWERITGLFS